MIGIGVLVVTVSVALFAVWSRQRTKNLLAYEKAADKFYSSIKPLLNDPETPEEVLDLLDFLNGQIVDRDGARGALYGLLGGNGDGRQAKRVKEMRSALDAFFERRPELEKPFIEATACALVAVILNGRGIHGIAARLLLKRILMRARTAGPELAENIYVRSDRGRGVGFGAYEPARAA